MTNEEYEKKVLSISSSAINQIVRKIGEYDNILYILTTDETLKSALMNNDENTMNKLAMGTVSNLMTGRAGDIEMHIIDNDSRLSYGTSNGSNLYSQTIYSNWGIFYKMNNSPAEIVKYPICYETGEGKRICLSFGKAVLNNQDEIIGYVILDVYRSAFTNLISDYNNKNTQYALVDSDNIIIFNTFLKDEGLYLTGERSLELENSFQTEDQSKTFVSRDDVGKSGFLLITVLKVDDYLNSMFMLLNISLAVVTIAVIVCIATAQLLARKFYRPVDAVVASMKEIANGNIQLRMNEDAESDDEMYIVSNGFNRMLDQINDLLAKVQEQGERQKTAEMKLLQAQISPHFLYNMLNEIKALAKLGRTGAASDFITNLGKLLRYSITNKDKFVTVDEDLQFVKAYLNLQKIRYEDSFNFELNICNDILNCMILNMVLQPIIENSIVHGFDGSNTNNLVQIRGYKYEQDRVIFEIYDNGVGISEEYMQFINNKGGSTSLYSGLGLENVQKRLLLAYGNDYGIKIDSRKGDFTKVTITIPYIDNEL